MTLYIYSHGEILVSTMKALFFDGNQNVHVEDVPRPVAGNGEVVVRVLHSGLCQAQFRRYFADLASSEIPGHEYVGRVEEVGEDVETLAKGDAVMCYPFRPCGTCVVCRAGHSPVCPFKKQPGINGGFGEYVAAQASNFLKIPEDFVNKHGVLLLDVFGMMYRAMQPMSIHSDSITAVVGILSYGLGAIEMAKKWGARVVAFDASPYRREIGLDLGADEVVDSNRDDLTDVVMSLTDGELFTEMIECDDPFIEFKDMFLWTRPGGQLSLEGHSNRAFDFNPNWITLNELTVTGTPLFVPEELPEILKIARNCQTKDRMVTHEPRLEQGQEVLALYAAGNAGKVAFDLT